VFGLIALSLALAYMLTTSINITVPACYAVVMLFLGMPIAWYGRRFSVMSPLL